MSERLVTDPPLTVEETRRRIAAASCAYCEEQGWRIAVNMGTEQLAIECCECMSLGDGNGLYDEDVAILPEAIAALRAAEAKIRRADGNEQNWRGE